MGTQYGTHFLHTVIPGETVYGLSVRYESNPETVIEVNGIYPPFTDYSLIFPGQLLVLPRLNISATETYYTVRPGDTLNRIAARFAAEPELIAGTNSTIQNPDYIYVNQQIRVPAFIYDIRMGDSIYTISQKTGVNVSDILNANLFRPAVSPDLIYEGTKLIIPLPHSRNISVFQPLPSDVVSEGSILEGFARAFEANVLYRITDNEGNVVTEETSITADAAGPEYGRFRTNIIFNVSPASPEGVLQVYTRSPLDNSIQDLTETKIRFN